MRRRAVEADGGAGSGAEVVETAHASVEAGQPAFTGFEGRANATSSGRRLADILSEAGIDPALRSGRRRRRADPEDELPDADPVEPERPRTDTAPVLGPGWSSAPTSWPVKPPPAAPAHAQPGAAPVSRVDMLTPAAPAAPTSHALVSPSPLRSPSALSSGSPTDQDADREHGPALEPAPALERGPDLGPDLDPDLDPREPTPGAVAGALSWAILLVELLASLGLGIGAWYAFSALWNLLPYVAAFAGPLVVTGLVAVAGALRARTGRNPLGLPTLCILVFAGTVLVILPAATLIVP